MVNQMAVYVGKKLSQIVEKPEEEEVLTYGAEVILGSLIKIIVLISLGALLGKLFYIFTVAIVFGTFRLVSGGCHLSTYNRCLIFSVTTIIGLGVFAEKLAYMKNYPYILGGLTLPFLILVILLWVPGANENREIKNKERRIRFKKYSIMFVMSIYAFVFLLWIFLNTEKTLPFICAIILGLFWQAFSITPLGYKLIKVADNLLDKVFKERRFSQC